MQVRLITAMSTITNQGFKLVKKKNDVSIIAAIWFPKSLTKGEELLNFMGISCGQHFLQIILELICLVLLISSVFNLHRDLIDPLTCLIF